MIVNGPKMGVKVKIGSAYEPKQREVRTPTEYRCAMPIIDEHNLALQRALLKGHRPGEIRATLGYVLFMAVLFSGLFILQ